MMKENKDLKQIYHLYENDKNQVDVHESPMNPKNDFQKDFGGTNTVPIKSFIYPLSTILKEPCDYPLREDSNLRYLRGGARKQIYFDPK